jgi:hypothetical protein
VKVQGERMVNRINGRRDCKRCESQIFVENLPLRRAVPVGIFKTCYGRLLALRILQYELWLIHIVLPVEALFLPETSASVVPSLLYTSDYLMQQ